MLLADPCFQLRSIRYLLGHTEPPAPGTALPAPDRKRFSLQSCELAGKRGLGWPGPGHSRGPGSRGHGGLTRPPTTDADYISSEELAQVEQMLAHLTSASAQAAAASLVSGAARAATPGARAHGCIRPGRPPPTLLPAAHQRGGPLPHLLRAPHLRRVPALWPQVLQVSGRGAGGGAGAQGRGQGAGGGAGAKGRGRGSNRALGRSPLPCRACINQHLMNNKDCFFCKTTIESVQDWKAGGGSATSSAA